MINVRMMPPEGARWTRVRVLCPDNHMHGAVYTLSTFDGEWVGVDFDADASEIESVVPAEEAAQLMKGRAWATAEEAAAHPAGAAQLNALVAMLSDGNPVAASANPDEEGHTRHRVRCPRPSCALDLPLTQSAVDALKEFTRHLWRAGVVSFELGDVRHWLQVASRGI